MSIKVDLTAKSSDLLCVFILFMNWSTSIQSTFQVEKVSRICQFFFLKKRLSSVKVSTDCLLSHFFRLKKFPVVPQEFFLNRVFF